MLPSVLAIPAIVPGITAGTFTVGNDTRFIGVSVDNPIFGVVPGTVSSAQQTINVAGIRAAWASAIAIGKALLFGPNTYQINDNLTFAAAPTVKICVLGIKGTTRIQSTVSVACSFTASMANTVLTVTAVASGGLSVGSTINSNGLSCTIRSFGTGTGGTGTYNVTVSQTVTSQAMTAGAPIVTIGNGTLAPNSLLNAEVFGLTIFGPSAAPSTGSTGIMVATMTFTKIHGCEVGNTTVGFDAINNCYGSTITDCISGRAGTCVVGDNIRGFDSGSTDAGAGNQVVRYNCWHTGTVAGVMVGPGADGINLSDGQIGTVGTTDSCGNVVLGQDFTSGLTGSTGKVILDGIDMEQFGGWGVRSFGQIDLDWRACPLISAGSLTAIGALKMTNAQNSRVNMQLLSARGPFSSAFPIVADGYQGADFQERLCVLDGSTWNGVAAAPLNIQSMLVASNEARGYAVWRDYQSGETRFWINGSIVSGATIVTAAATAGALDPTTDVNVGPVLNPAMIRGTADGAAIATAMDSSYTQATSSLQPLLRSSYSTAALPNAKPVLVFDGIDDYLANNGSASVAQTVFVVAKLNTVAPAIQALVGSDSGGGFALRVQGSTTLLIEADYTAGIGSASVTLETTRYHVFAGSYANPGAWSIWYDGKKLGSGLSTTSLTAGRSRTVGKQSSGNPLSANIAKIIPINAVLTDAQILRYSAWLKTEFGTA